MSYSDVTIWTCDDCDAQEITPISKTSPKTPPKGWTYGDDADLCAKCTKKEKLAK